MCLKSYVFADLWDSVLYNFSELMFNVRFILPYGIFRIFIIIFLTGGWIASCFIIRNDGMFNAYLSIALIAWFISIFILALGTFNIINFPSLLGCHWLALFTISDFLFLILIGSISIASAVNAAGPAINFATFLVCAIFGFLAAFFLLVSFIWSLIELYRIRELRVRILTAIKRNGDLTCFDDRYKDLAIVELETTKYYPSRNGPFNAFVEINK